METVLFQKFAPLISGYWIPKTMGTCYWRWYLEQPYGISWCKDVDAAGRWKPLGDRVIDGPKLSLGWLDGKVMISNMPLCRSECFKVIMPWCHIMAICSGSSSIIPLGFAWFCHTCTGGRPAQHSASCHSMSFLTHLCQVCPLKIWEQIRHRDWTG